MIILALVGSCGENEAFYHSLCCELGKSRVQRLSLSWISDEQKRMDRARYECRAPISDEFVSLITGFKTVSEVSTLRQYKNVAICHQYPCAAQIYDQLSIESGDFLVSTKANVPAHVFTLADVWSVTRLSRKQYRGVA